MSLPQYTFVAVGGVLAGALNVVAAGGAVLSFLVLSTTGLPPHIANATNLTATPASFVGVIPRVWRTRRQNARHWPMLVAAVMGTIAGVTLFRLIPPDNFRAVAPILLMLAAVTLIAHPFLKRFLDKRREADKSGGRHPMVVAGLFATSVYAGFFGGGVGVLVLVVLAVATAWPWLEANATKNLVCLVTAVVGVAAFAFTGLVDWVLAIVLGAAMAAGGLLGQWLIGRLPGEGTEDLLRETVAVCSAFGAGVMVATL
jgi:uncharacterized membrane protein YfcA